MITGRAAELEAARRHGGEDAVSGRWIDLLYLIPILLISLTAHEVAHG